MTRTRGVELLLVALGLLGLAWSVAPRSVLPLYDGVGFPDEPYRFVVHPVGAKATKAPTTASGSAAVSGAGAGAIHASSAEQAPQVNVLIPIGRLRAPAGTQRVVVHATPVQPITAPDNAYLWSNVYDIAATIGSVTLRNATPPATITLRAATAQRPDPTIERFTAAGWIKLATVPVGNDVYEAALPALGRYAVIGPVKLDFAQLTPGGGSKTTTYTGVIVATVAGVVVIMLFAVGRRRRANARRARDDDAQQDDAQQGDAQQGDAQQGDAQQGDAQQGDARRDDAM